MDARPTSKYSGDFIAWPGGCALIGTGKGAIAPHSHYAIQVCIGSPSGPKVQFGRNGAWQPTAGAIIPSRSVHSIDVNECDWSTVIFVEPETPEGKAIAARIQGKLHMLDAAAIELAARRLERAWRVDCDRDAVTAIYQQIVRDISQTAPRVPSDPRVIAAVDFIRQSANDPITLEGLAEKAHLSPSRFRHLFVQETGMPLRTYLLWRRLLRVWELLSTGESLSAAAHAAGFADSAHLSRTSRTMFGVQPSLLQMNGPLSARKKAATSFTSDSVKRIA